MNYCKNCGRQIKQRAIYCCETCRFAYYRKTAEITNPPAFTHCQNPKCGKKLEHWIKAIRKNGDIAHRYYPEQKYCDRKCAGEHKKIYMVGKKRPDISVKAKKRRKILSPKIDKKEESQEYSCDPFACQDVYLD